jgi:hypothetical protein
MKRETTGKIKQGGFSMIELLVSFTVIMLLVIGITELMIYSMRVKLRGDISIQAAELAASKLEFLKSLPFDDPGLSDGINTEKAFGEDKQKIFWRTWIIKKLSPHMKKIEMTCFFENHKEKQTRIILFISEKLGF